MPGPGPSTIWRAGRPGNPTPTAPWASAVNPPPRDWPQAMSRSTTGLSCGSRADKAGKKTPTGCRPPRKRQPSSSENPNIIEIFEFAAKLVAVLQLQHDQVTLDLDKGPLTLNARDRPNRTNIQFPSDTTAVKMLGNPSRIGKGFDPECGRRVRRRSCRVALHRKRSAPFDGEQPTAGEQHGQRHGRNSTYVLPTHCSLLPDSGQDPFLNLVAGSYRPSNWCQHLRDDFRRCRVPPEPATSRPSVPSSSRAWGESPTVRAVRIPPPQTHPRPPGQPRVRAGTTGVLLVPVGHALRRVPTRVIRFFRNRRPALSWGARIGGFRCLAMRECPPPWLVAQAGAGYGSAS